MKRRRFIQTTGTGIAAICVGPAAAASGPTALSIRLGGPLFEHLGDPESWVSALKKAGYRAAYCPVGPEAGEDLIRAYKTAASRHDIVIAEVGAWSNPLSPDPEEADRAIEKCIQGLRLADQIGARCCVNISGSRNKNYWAGPHPDNLTAETFEMVVEITRKIIDAVKPTRSYFALEAMPWSFPDSADTYLQLLRAIDRERFGVHLDPTDAWPRPLQ
jgi:sugar phosphate isomerase/epimerase